MSTTIYLRFPDEAAFLSLMPPEFVRVGETGAPLPEDIEALRIVGALFTEPALDVDGNATTPPVRLDGFHVNLLAEAAPAGWEAFEVQPKTPRGTFTPGPIVLPPEWIPPEPQYAALEGAE